jgi:hypothetical protein
MNQIDFLNNIKRQVIIAVLADDELVDHLVLKGGNLLQFAYGLTTRASKDVDISVDGDLADEAFLHDRVKLILERTLLSKGQVVFDFKLVKKPAQISDDLKTFWGGYQCEFKIIDKDQYDSAGGLIDRIRRLAHPVDDSGSTKFKIDFSRHEFCDDKEQFEIDGYTFFGYSPRMFVAEKLRAICQQMPEYADIVHRNRPASSRARDFVDIHTIVNHYGVDFSDPDFHDILRKTFEAKKVPIEWIAKIAETRDFHEPDFISVMNTVSPSFDLQSFDFYFDDLCERCNSLETLWNV